MSEQNTAQPIETPAVEAEVTETEVAAGAPVSSSEEPLSFEAWLAKREGKEAPPEEAKKVDHDQIQKEILEKIAKTKEPAKEEVKKVEEPVKEEAVAPAKVKVGDKEYAPEEIQTMLAERDSLSKKDVEVQAQLSQLVEMLKTNPGAILDKLDTPREALEEYYYKKFLEEDTLTPEQKLERYKKADEDRKNQEKRAQEEMLRKQQEEQQKQESERNRSYWISNSQSAIKDSGLPETQFTVNTTAALLKEELSKGNDRIQAKDVIGKVKEQYKALQQEAIDTLDAESLYNFLGEERLNKLREVEAKKTKSKLEQSTKSVIKERQKDKTRKVYTNPLQFLEDL